VLESTQSRPTAVAQDAAGRRHLLALGAGAGLLGLGAALGWDWWQSRQQQSPEEKFWRYSFEAIQGPPIHARSLHGRPLLVNFWATWCAPCIEEMPLIDSFYRKNKSNNHQVLGIAVDKPEAVQAFQARLPVQYPLVLLGAHGGALGKELGNLTGGLPFTVFFASDGHVMRRKMGKLVAADLDSWASIS
jgi:thiol-disulfide isomerase/thioredoxin